MKRVVLGLGTNLGDRRENLRAALAALSHLPKTEGEGTLVLMLNLRQLIE